MKKIENKTDKPRSYGNDKISVVVPANSAVALSPEEHGVLAVALEQIKADVQAGLIIVT